MDILEKIISKQPAFRKEIIRNLHGFLSNPGRFSILLLGKSGTGKSYWINELVEKIENKPDCWEGIISINAYLSKEWDEKKWDEIFKIADKKIMVIKDVENLSKMAQSILFEFLSTKKGGLYGFTEKTYECRIIFTSTFHIKTLREDREILLLKFFDRISQLVLEFPSFSDNNTAIWNDFISTWSKMNFSTDDLPTKTFENWLKLNSKNFHGNFRDLDKLVINWRNYQIMGVEDKIIYQKVIDDFNNFNHFPEHDSENQFAFYIDENQNYYDKIEPDFRRKIKNLAKLKYGKLSLAPEGKPFGVPYRTMERW